MCRLCGKNTRKLYWLDDEDIVINGMWYLSNKMLCADNSAEEYGEAQMIIRYCPLCGKELD